MIKKWFVFNISGQKKENLDKIGQELEYLSY